MLGKNRPGVQESLSRRQADEFVNAFNPLRNLTQRELDALSHAVFSGRLGPLLKLRQQLGAEYRQIRQRGEQIGKSFQADGVLPVNNEIKRLLTGQISAVNAAISLIRARRN